ncbi:MAG TPA: hypothetical protein VFO76_13265 [Candidatus Kapabacteria bacterium]|nr:hypothetical protein [Candidatus Kapabacteria bacterium]
MKITIASLIAVICLFTSTLFAQHSADVPHVISYQGKITSATTPLPDGEHNFTVRLYGDEQGTSVLWQGEYRTTVTDGLFNLQLGSGGQDLPAVHSGLWLGMQIDGGTEMKPYTSITAAPYALSVANGSITAEKMNTDYVSSIKINGKKIGGKASELNIIGGGGVSLLYDEKKQALVVYDDQINTTPQQGSISDVNKGGTGVGTIAQNGIMWGNGTNPISATALNSGQLLIGSTGAPVAASLTGTANQINVTNGSGSITLSTPQSIATSSSPTFSNLTLSGKAISAATTVGDATATLTTKGYVDGAISSATALSSGKIMIGTTGGTPTAANLTGTVNQINVASASGSITLSTPQNIGTTSSPSFSNLTLTGKATSAATSAADAATTLTTKGYVDGAISTATALPSGQIMVGTIGGTPTATFLTGTSNQINVSNASGSITLSTPQDIGTASSPTFSNLTLSGKATSTATDGADDATTLTTKGYVDDAIAAIPIAPSWELAGNAGTSSSNDFVGTLDAADLVFRTNNLERMRLSSDGAFLLNGTSGAVPITGGGTRLMWVPSMGAFRAGRAIGSGWNDFNIGINSFATGYGNVASGNYSNALGFSSSAYGAAAFAAGSAVTAVTDAAVAMGSASIAAGLSSLAIGDNAVAWGDVSVALGESTEANGFASMATGYSTITTGDYAFVSGKNLTIGTGSFGFNGSTTGSTVNVSALGRVGYFGDVDLMIGNDDNNPRSLKFYEANASGTYSGTNYTAIKAQNQSANITYTLPATQGAAGSVMTNNGSGTMSWSDPKVLAYATVSAGATITIPSTAAVVKINDDGDSTMANAVTMPSGTNGKLLYIYNDDAEPTTGDVTIASGAMGTYVYVDGWRKAN